jgi:hypothetical protein
MSEEHSPLVTKALLWKIVTLLAVLAALSVALSIGGKYYGDWLIRDGQTLSAAPVALTIGQDRLTLPQNTIRFKQQRHSGAYDSVNAYVTWPDMQGYTEATAPRFDDPAQFKHLIFMEFSQSVMSRDMSGRLEPIYSKLFLEPATAGPAGLTVHRLDPKAGYDGEVIMTAEIAPSNIYVVRCLMPATADAATSADCQRDIHVGHDLTLLYRFSSDLLPEWRKLDAAVYDFSGRHLDAKP